MNTVKYEPGAKSAITPEDIERYEAAAVRLDSEVDYTDNPPLPEDFMQRGVPSPFYRPLKTQTSIRLDNDVLAWLKRGGKGYQTRVNAILREAMVRDLQQAAAGQAVPDAAGA